MLDKTEKIAKKPKMMAGDKISLIIEKRNTDENTPIFFTKLYTPKGSPLPGYFVNKTETISMLMLQSDVPNKNEVIYQKVPEEDE